MVLPGDIWTRVKERTRTGKSERIYIGEDQRPCSSRASSHTRGVANSPTPAWLFAAGHQERGIGRGHSGRVAPKKFDLRTVVWATFEQDWVWAWRIITAMFGARRMGEDNAASPQRSKREGEGNLPHPSFLAYLEWVPPGGSPKSTGPQRPSTAQGPGWAPRRGSST